MVADLYNIKAEKVGTVDLPDRIFARKWAPSLVHQALTTQVANARERIAESRGRGEVRGGGRKPWQQKGTGRARHGSIRSPIWKGGGVSHGPKAERNYAKKINKKMAQAALFSTLSKRMESGEIKIIDKIAIGSPKTRELSNILKNFYKNTIGSTLIVPEQKDKNIYVSSRNLPKIKALDAKSLNIYDLLKYKTILIAKNAIEVINKHYAVSK
ncbi:MAG: 50S ribosomal protein L4 [Candidatus Colwellbacteria bacterium]|nr:50S ribosomal protein L4 [Candidatus Colwellbacteria bacterium]